MKEWAFRCKENDDLKEKIIEFCDKNNISSAIVLCAVGCVKEVNIRKAKALEDYHNVDDYEIVSLTGTISKDGVHLHISLSDESLNTIGGHLKEGTIVNTTCEIVLGEMENYQFSREFDPSTGYRELVIEELTKQ